MANKEKLDLDAAFESFERKMDTKIDAKIGDLRNEIGRQGNAAEKKREMTEDEIYEETDLEMDKIKDSCRRSEESLEKVWEQLQKLEKAFDRFRSQYASEELEDHDITNI